jgi:hypothetical protein
VRSLSVREWPRRSPATGVTLLGESRVEDACDMEIFFGSLRQTLRSMALLLSGTLGCHISLGRRFRFECRVSHFAFAFGVFQVRLAHSFWLANLNRYGYAPCSFQVRPVFLVARRLPTSDDFFSCTAGSVRAAPPPVDSFSGG